MFDAIHRHEQLSGLVRGTCFENDVGICFDQSLLDANGGIRDDVVLILKVDQFYSSGQMHDPPPSVDCLIIVRCEEKNGYEFYLVELRNTGVGGVRHDAIRKKFETALGDFIGFRFAEIFLEDPSQVLNIRMYLVTDPHGIKGHVRSSDEWKERMKGSVLDAYGSMRPFQYGNKLILIEPVMPNPAIAGC